MLGSTSKNPSPRTGDAARPSAIELSWRDEAPLHGAAAAVVAEDPPERLCKQCGRPVGWDNDYCAGCAG